MADPTLSKLLSVDSDLGVQEAKLSAQLEAIQAKRASLQTVLEMFDAGQTATLEIEKVSAPIAAIAKGSAAPPTATPTEASPSRKGAKGKDKGGRQSGKASGSLKATLKGWREYVRDEYRKTPLPKVVSGILQSQPKKVFKIADVVDTIFVKTIPQTARKSARERVSNILAEGARKQHWYSGGSGCYIFSK